MTTLEWDEVFDCAVAAWCRSSTSQEMLRMCFQSRTRRNEVSVGWTANELMAFATGIALLVASPTHPAEQAAPKAAPVAFLKSVIALCSHRGYSPANIEAWDKDDKWIADLWRQAESMLAAPPAEQAAPKAAPGDAIDEAMRERDDAEDFIAPHAMSAQP